MGDFVMTNICYRIKNGKGITVADVYNKHLADRFRERGYKVELWKYNESKNKWNKTKIERH